MSVLSRTVSKVMLAALLAGMIVVPNVEACACAIPMFHSENSQVTSTAKAPEQIIIWDGKTENFFVDFKLEGNATDFGAVIPLPAEAEIAKASHEQFAELRKFTAPKRASRNPISGNSYMSEGVQVVREDAVGSYWITTLKATDTAALLQWLTDHSYKYTDADKANFAYYVDQGKFYFLAIQINTDKKTDASGDYDLHPLVFTFPTEVPYLPLRYMAGHDELPDTLTLYTMTPRPVFVEGSLIEYSNLLTDTSSLSSFWGYAIKDKWLTRSIVTLDTSKIDRDPQLVEWTKPEPIKLFGQNVAQVVPESATSVAHYDSVNSTVPFLDLQGHFSASHVARLYQLGIVSGRTSTTFVPDSSLTRAEALKLVVKAFFADSPLIVSALGTSFGDVASTDWYAPYVEFGLKQGVISAQQNFAPNRVVSRAEFVKMITAAALQHTTFSLSELNNNFEKTFAATTFLDLPKTEWFTPYIRAGFMIGGLDSRAAFYPNNSVTRGEAAKILSVVMQNVLE